MAASTAQNPAVKSESRSAKKKKATKSTSADTEPLTANPVEATPSNGPTESNNGDGSYESPYIKELYKWVISSRSLLSNFSSLYGTKSS
jgi:hypothetical protein